ncbi:MAG: PorT family protein [Muribaculaceae bacterium]|nr:PorT family protein [Muribaculaceae bacterium]
MKQISKIALAGALLLAGASTANAGWRFGIKAGLNLDNLKVADMSDFKHSFDPDNRCGWTAGIMTEFEVPVVGICADASLMYTRMENSFRIPVLDMASSTLPVNVASDQTNAGRNFIEIPVNVKWKLNIPLVSRIVKPMIMTGPAFAFKLDKNPVNAVLKAKTCQVAWNIGVGVELFKHLQVQGQYGFGINKVADIVDKLTPVHIKTEDLKVKNNYWTITAAWLF